MTDVSRVTPKMYNTKLQCLRVWEEVVGTFQGFEISYEDNIIVVLSLGNKKSRFLFSTDGIAAKIFKKKLDQRVVGEEIAILRTDQPTRPIVIRTP
jgi:hypothetical protein